jgi:hypothetical protein
VKTTALFFQAIPKALDRRADSNHLHPAHGRGVARERRIGTSDGVRVVTIRSRSLRGDRFIKTFQPAFAL